MINYQNRNYINRREMLSRSAMGFGALGMANIFGMADPNIFGMAYPDQIVELICGIKLWG